MASNGVSSHSFTPVLNALATMQSNVDRAVKTEAHEFLESFQKSPEAWTTAFGILQSESAPSESKLFAATTLKGKIVYDLHQLPRDSLPSLRDSLMGAIVTFSSGPKPIRTQLCVCLANLALQMTEWKNALTEIASTLGNDASGIPCVLEFLRVLPEEVTEGRKISLSEDELISRTKELLEDNSQHVLRLLSQYANSSADAGKNPQLLECVNAWIREVPLNDIVNSPLLSIVFNAVSNDESFEAAVECICSIIKETRDVDECINTIQTLYPRVVGLRPKIAEAASEEDSDTFKGLTRLFAEAGESWVVLIARMPETFQDLVQSVLEAAARDKEREAISYTFNFWYELKQYLTLEKYIQARLQYVEAYAKLVDIMIVHLEYPKPESGDEKDLFEGDRDQEEKFREFRHQMGDVLKDCCEVIGVTLCLQKSFDLIEQWVKSYGSRAGPGLVPEWQKLEAPLFSMRAMGRMVPSDESIMLPRLVPLIVQIPDHEKVRFQAVMALGRYTEWTAQHPDTLQPQLDFIMAAFDHSSKEVMRAAALSFKFFCNDCAELLHGFVPQIQQFYSNVLDKLPPSSQEELTDGVASVVAKQPLDKIYETLKLYCDPVMQSIINLAQSATDEPSKLVLADKLQLLTIFIQWVQPYTAPGDQNPAVKYCQEIFPALGAIAQNFDHCIPILERVCRCWRYMVFSYRTAMTPLLPELADRLVGGFATSRQGCFLWATDAVVREFSEGKEGLDPAVSNAVFDFYERQATTFLRALSDVPPEELPDLIEDFFRLTGDVLLFNAYKAIPSSLMAPILSAASTALTLLKEEPLMATLHFMRDFLAYGSERMPISTFPDGPDQPTVNPPEIQSAVKQLVTAQGQDMVQRLLTGMMYSFPRDCVPDASGALLQMLHLLPQHVATWIKNTINLLPAGSMTPQESERLVNNIHQRVRAGEVDKIRPMLQDFTTSYRRRNVAPREGLGRLEATRFKFSG